MYKYYCSKETIDVFELCNKVDMYNNADLSVEIVEKGIICPLELSETKQQEYKMWGGVLNGNYEFVPASLQRRKSGETYLKNIEQNWYVGAKPQWDRNVLKYIDESVVFIGPIKRHFAHFYLETLSRVWYLLKEENKNLKIAFLTQEWDKPNWKNFYKFFDLLGIDKERLIEIKQYTQFKEVIIPEQSYIINSFYHKEFRQVIDKIMENIKPAGYKKVFFSKKYNWKGTGRTIGDDIAEEIFRSNGFKVFHPEGLSLIKTLEILKGCKQFVAQSGSNSHNAIFCSEGTELLILNRSRHAHPVQTMINQLRNLNVTYIDCFYPFLPVDYTIGPFTFYFSKYVEKYLIDNKMKFRKKRAMQTSSENILKYIKSWYCMYCNSSKKYIEEFDFNLEYFMRNVAEL